MARIARVVVPDYPHHITQRGSRSQQTFFSAGDYQTYIELLAQFKRRFEIEIWAYCLMPNHVHLVAVPGNERRLAGCLARTHRSYALRVNQRNGWRGHLWQERFFSCVLDEEHLLCAVRYTELNPVRAKLCGLPAQWRWSSARAHLNETDDQLVSVKPMLDRVNDWDAYLASYGGCVGIDDIRRHTKTGRPAGRDGFVRQIENVTGRKLRKQRPGPKRRQLR